MEDFVNSTTHFNLDMGGLIMFLIVSVFIGLFHTVILRSIYQWDYEFKPLFFILNPSLILLAYFIANKYVALLFIVMFLSVFVLAILGMFIVAPILQVRKSIQEQDAYAEKYNRPKIPLWKKILKVIGALLMVPLMFFFPVYIVFFLILYGIYKFILSYNRGFYHYESLLPTSNIRSVAMGQAEIKGKIVLDEILNAPMNSKRCAGYVYSVEKRETDSDGDKSYTLISQDVQVRSFYLQDETGKIKINPERLEWVSKQADEEKEYGGKRYTQYILKEGEEYMIIGKVGLEKNTPTMMYDEVTKVFGIAPYESVQRFVRYRPLLNSFLFYMAFFAIVVALIMLVDIRTSGNTVTIDFKHILPQW